MIVSGQCNRQPRHPFRRRQSGKASPDHHDEALSAGLTLVHPLGPPNARHSTGSTNPRLITIPHRLPRPRARPQDARMSESLLDMKGTTCPIPVLRANRALRSMAPGERLRVLATDRASVADFQAYCRETGHALLAWSEENGVFSFVIRRRAEDPEQKD
jgi:tRNA 2-thiouridine synthesizing protein A